MSAIGLSYHAGQRSLERNYFRSASSIQKLLSERKAFIVPAKYGRKGVYIPEDNKIVIVNSQITKTLTFTDPADYYQNLLTKADEILENPHKIKFGKNGRGGHKKIFFSEDGYEVHTTLSGKSIL